MEKCEKKTHDLTELHKALAWRDERNARILDETGARPAAFAATSS